MPATVHSFGIFCDADKQPTDKGHITINLPDGKQWYTAIRKGETLTHESGWAVTWPAEEREPRLASV